MLRLNQKGSFMIWFTLAFALLGTFVGFALDFGRAYLEKARVARLVDGSALAAAKVLKGQAVFEPDATRAACDAMAMNGAPVVFSGGNTCTATQGAPMSAAVEFYDLPASGGPPVRAVRVTGTEPVPTTFLRFLGWMVPGNDYSTINVVARAEAGPERPVDLMMVLDRSGSMTSADGSGQPKIDALKTAVNAFLGIQNTFSANDRIGMSSFSNRGCGDPATGRDSASTAATCAPDVALDFASSSFITSLQNKVNALVADGGTNTMEALRVARPLLAQAFADPNRSTARKAVLLVTDGQPTFMRRDDDSQCKKNPKTGADLPRNGTGDAGGGPFNSGCIQGAPQATSTTSGFLYRHQLTPIPSNSCFYVRIPGSWTSSGCPTNSSTQTSGSPTTDPTLYRNLMECTRSLSGCVTNGAMYEADQIRNCGFNNSACTPGGEHGVLFFAIAIGKKDLTQPQQSLDENAKCMLARMANAEDILDASTGVVTKMATICNQVFTTIDGDTHVDLKVGCGATCVIDPNQQKGKVFTIDVTGNVEAQLKKVFSEIASILKLRLVL